MQDVWLYDATGDTLKVLITGGSGFLGSHIANELNRRGHETLIFDTRTPDRDGHHFVRGDVRDYESLLLSLSGCSAIFHCAALADLDTCRQEPEMAVQVNVLGTLNALKAAAESGVKRFMHASSVYVFSRSGSIYKTTKLAAENVLTDLAQDLQLQTTILRFGSLYGPGADSGNAILRIVRQAVLDKKIDFWGDGREVREYIHIRDAAGLAVDALEEKYSGSSLHIAGRERITTREVLEVVNEMLGGNISIVMHDEPFEGRYRLTPYSIDFETTQRLTGESYVDLGLGLMEVIESVRSS